MSGHFTINLTLMDLDFQRLPVFIMFLMNTARMKPGTATYASVSMPRAVIRSPRSDVICASMCGNRSICCRVSHYWQRSTGALGNWDENKLHSLAHIFSCHAHCSRSHSRKISSVTFILQCTCCHQCQAHHIQSIRHQISHMLTIF